MKPIGVFDSGLGGLTVAAALNRKLPNEQLIYLGDTARLPYGTKSASTVIRYSLQIANFLVSQGIKLLVAACNTASAHAVDALREALPIPVLGVVEPGAREAAHRTTLGQIGVIGTLGTVGSGAYRRALQDIRSDLVVFSQPCPLLVPLAEEGWHEHPVTAEVARHYLSQLRQQSGDLDTIVLGCTHYPLLKKTLADQASGVFGHPVELVDSADAVAQAVADELVDKDLTQRGSRVAEDRFFVTDDSRFAELAARFLGRRISAVENADI